MEALTGLARLGVVTCVCVLAHVCALNVRTLSPSPALVPTTLARRPSTHQSLAHPPASLCGNGEKSASGRGERGRSVSKPLPVVAVSQWQTFCALLLLDFYAAMLE